jgi:hypothetical protein
MVIHVVGRKKLDFVDSNNNPVKGTQLFANFSDDSEVEGLSADKFFIKDSQFTLPANLVGASLNVEFSRKGKLIGITPASQTIKLDIPPKS